MFIFNRHGSYFTVYLLSYLHNCCKMCTDGRGAEHCDQFVWNRWTDLHEIFMHIPCGRGSVFLGRRCDTLCTSGLWMTSRLAVMGGMAMSGRLDL